MVFKVLTRISLVGLFCAFIPFLVSAKLPVNPTDSDIYHLLNRLGYGPAPGDIENVRAMGLEKFIYLQLNPSPLVYSFDLTQKLNAYKTLQLKPYDILQEFVPFTPKGMKLDQSVQEQARKSRAVFTDEAINARFTRAIYSPRQLEEVMTDFWFNHFNVFSGKDNSRNYLSSYETQAIRPYVFGKFRDLLGATAHHPAMLFYLDNWQNIASRVKNTGEVVAGINENYARELMELHTLGVNGGYTQADVIQLAKILTGWSICNHNEKPPNSFGFCFHAKQHENGDKLFLGQVIASNGEQEGEEALDILANSPATAKHISYKLAQYFVTDEPPQELVKVLSRKFQQTQGDIRATLQLLLTSDTFWSQQYREKKFKTPYQYIVSSIRATGLPVTNFKLLQGTLNKLGMPLYGCLTPDGYKNTQEAWLNPQGLLVIINYVTALTGGHLPLVLNPDGTVPNNKGAHYSQPVNAGTLLATLGNNVALETLAKILAAPQSMQATLIFSSKEFMYR